MFTVLYGHKINGDDKEIMIPFSVSPNRHRYWLMNCQMVCIIKRRRTNLLPRVLTNTLYSTVVALVHSLAAHGVIKHPVQYCCCLGSPINSGRNTIVSLKFTNYILYTNQLEGHHVMVK